MQDRVAGQDACCGHDHGASGHAHPASPAPVRLALGATLMSARAACMTRDGRVLVDHVDLDLSAGEIVTLVGPNGAGKTTLVRLMLGLERPDSGSVIRADGLIVGYVPQRFAMDRSIPLTVTRFVALCPGATADAARTALQEAGAAPLADRQVARLSGGEMQRVLLARALVRRPHVLVLDEPASGVDHLGEAELYSLIGRLRTARGLAVLLVSHDLHVVMAQSDRVVCLNRHVCCSGVPHTVARHPEYIRLFGPEAARAFGVYHHHHDHHHDLGGAPHVDPPVVAAPDAVQKTGAA